MSLRARGLREAAQRTPGSGQRVGAGVKRTLLPRLRGETHRALAGRPSGRRRWAFAGRLSGRQHRAFAGRLSGQRRRALAALTLGWLAAVPLSAQEHMHHDMAGARWWHAGLHGVFMGSHVRNGVGGEPVTEGYLTQPTVMAGASGWGGRLAGMATISLEGLTLRRGELAPGGYGEGYVDRRHPHTYLHELLLTLRSPGEEGVSVSAGRGFAPFGTDDPMVRPFVRFPVNHHLAQVLERLVLIGAARRGPLLLEAGLFSGDEPSGPTDPGTLDRFGDSWAVRLTAMPVAGLELQGSRAQVTSPELPLGGGWDQRKWSASLRLERPLGGGGAYGLVEWARTTELDGAAEVFSFGSVLGEASYARSGLEGRRAAGAERAAGRGPAVRVPHPLARRRAARVGHHQVDDRLAGTAARPRLGWPAPGAVRGKLAGARGRAGARTVRDREHVRPQSDLEPERGRARGPGRQTRADGALRGSAPRNVRKRMPRMIKRQQQWLWPATAVTVLAGCADSVAPPFEQPPVDSPQVEWPVALVETGAGVVSERYTSEIAERDGWAYTATWGARAGTTVGNAVKIWNVSGPVTLVDSLIISGARTTGDVQISPDGALLMVATEYSPGSVVLFDRSNPAKPVEIARFSSANTQPGVHTAKFGTVGGKLYGFLSVDPSGSVPARLVIIDLSVPVQPREVFAQAMGQPFVHDVNVRDGILFTALWDDGLSIWDIGGGGAAGSPASPVLLGNVQTATGNIHNVWWFQDQKTGSRRYALLGEEGPGSVGTAASGDIHVIDVSDLHNPREVAIYHIPGAGTHNFWADEANGFLYTAYYNAGVRVLDVRGDLGTCPAEQKTVAGLCDLALMGREAGTGLETGHYIWGVVHEDGSLFASDMLLGLIRLDASALKR